MRLGGEFHEVGQLPGRITRFGSAFGQHNVECSFAERLLSHKLLLAGYTPGIRSTIYTAALMSCHTIKRQDS